MFELFGFFAILMIGIIIVSVCPDAEAKEAPIKIGSVIPLTGPYAHIAKAQQNGAELAVEKLNKEGGVLGRKLELYVRDSELSSAVAIRRLEGLINIQKIDWLVGTLSGGISMAMNVIAKKANIPYVIACQAVEKLHKKGFIGPYTYTVASATYQPGYAGSEFVLNNLGKKLYLLYSDYAWGHAIRDGWKAGVKKWGGEIVGMDGAPIGTHDFSPYLTKARTLKPDVFVVCTAGGDCLRTIKQAYEFGLNKEMKIYSSVMALPIGMAISKEFQNCYAGIDFLWNLDLPSTKEFTKLYTAKYGKPPDSYAYYAWAGTNELALAAKRAGSIDPASIAKELKGSTFDWGKGPVTWRSCDRTAIQKWWIIKGKEIENIKEKWDIFEVVGKTGGPDSVVSCEELGYK